MADAARAERFGRVLGATAVAWVALLGLMLLSLASAYLNLGPWNVVAGLAIAAIKSAIVVWLFMRMRTSGPLIRLAAAAGVGVLAILSGLSGVDYLTRAQTPSAVQRPQQLLPPQPAPSARQATGR
jgi:cytochrome c oxidase subunit 4